jgi:DNA topoisomerase-1
MEWTSLIHTGPLERECKNVKQRLLLCYEKHKHKYENNDVFHTNFRKSYARVDARRRIVPSTNDTEPSFRCVVDGETVSVPNPYLESPCVFVGHHPLRGTCKVGIPLSEVVINVSTHHIPKLRAKGFTRFVFKPTARWFASWKDEVTRERKYLFFTPTNINNNNNKFEHARTLKRKLPAIRKQNMERMQSSQIKDVQLGLAAYFIEHLCIRIGNEKEYDTIGACTLTCDHVRLLNERRVRVTFLGKDHVPFDRTVRANEVVCEAIAACKRYAKMQRTESLFSCVTPNILNRYLTGFHSHVTAKVFRTCKASMLFQSEFRKHGNKKDALMKVAVLLNHKKKKASDNKYVHHPTTSWNNYVDQRIFDDPSFVF